MMAPRSDGHEPVKGDFEARQLVSHCRRSIGHIKKHPELRRLLKGLKVRQLTWDRPLVDLESTRHMLDDREVCYVTASSEGNRLEFTIDYVYDGAPEGRPSHQVAFEFSCGGHFMNGQVILPLVGETGRVSVQRWRIQNED